MILQTTSLTIRRSTLIRLIPVISILCTNSILAIGTNPETQREKICLTVGVESMMAVDTIDYSVLTQGELKQELKKLKKTDRELYNKVKSEFLKLNAIDKLAIGSLAISGALLLGFITGCAIYSSE